MSKYYNVNLRKLEDLAEIFFQLDDEYQDKLLVEALLLKYGLESKDLLTKDSIPSDEKKLALSEFNRCMGLVKKFDEFDENKKAAVLMLLENRVPGALTEDLGLGITMRRKRVSVERYIKENLPKADLKEAEEILKGAFV